MPELITSSQDLYEALAIELASNPARLAEVKSKLASKRLTAPLFDTPAYTKNLESAYVHVYENHHAISPPDHADLTPHAIHR
jgi:protein O-GlcNAc transferase